MEFIRGEIVIANLKPIKGSEQGGVRPVLIIQNDTLNKYSPTIIVAPITSKVYTKEYPTNVIINKEDSKLKLNSTILLNQIRTIDKRRIVKKIGFIDNFIMNKVDMALKISLALD
ncbi:MAG TPA: type II toxin-antitoxin system PemK/MazF family toxin [Candidatus Pacearchaeota archaeon]|nr:type II toxin-antitoxin system PemK/MazF family toxin [Candidatus Pacearchaeota archaeon]